MSEFGHIAKIAAGVCIDSFGCGPFVIVVDGETFKFEDSDRFGPTILNTRGGPAAKQPANRSLFWKAHCMWRRQGKQVEHGLCVWKRWKNTKVRHLGGRSYELIEPGDSWGGEEMEIEIVGAAHD